MYDERYSSASGKFMEGFPLETDELIGNGSSLMLKMAQARHDHNDLGAIGGLNDIVVGNRTATLNDRLDPALAATVILSVFGKASETSKILWPVFRLFDGGHRAFHAAGLAQPMPTVFCL